MVDKRISELTEKTSAGAGDFLALVDTVAAETKKITTLNLGVGQLGASAWVIASNAPIYIKTCGQKLEALGYRVWVCDGVDDHVEIHEALAAVADDGGGTIDMSVGTLTCGNISFATYSNIKLSGAGNKLTKIVVSSDVEGISTYGSSTPTSNITLEDFEIDGSAQTTNTSDRSCISAGKVTGLRISRVYAHNSSYYGFNLWEDNDVVIEDCEVSYNYDDGIHPATDSMGYGYNYKMHNNNCHHNGANGIYDRGNSANTNVFLSHDIRNNACYLNTEYGISAVNQNGVRVEENDCYSNGKSGVRVDGNYPIIKGNNTLNNANVSSSYSGINMFSGTGAQIEGNNCNDNQATVTDLLAANANSGQKNVAVTTVPLFFVGQTVTLLDGATTENCIIDSISGSILTMTTNLANSYTTAGAANCQGVATQSYGIALDNPVIKANIINNECQGNVTGKINARTDAGHILTNNRPGVAAGELRTISGSLVAGTVGEVLMIWQNPEAQGMMTTARTYISTGATAAATGDMGLVNTVAIIEDCEDAWSNGTHGTAAISTTYAERGTYCQEITIASGITNDDIVAYENKGAMDLSTATHIWFKFRSDVALNAGDVDILLDETNSCVSPEYHPNLPAIVANKTYTLCLALNAGAAAGATCDAVVSVGIRVLNNTRAVAGTHFNIDDIRGVTIGNELVNDADLQATGIANYTTPIHVGPKATTSGTDDLDCIALVSAAQDSTGIVGSWYLTIQGE